ncbi:serine/threonine-protein kinase [Kribbella amoyensis]|uniref:non-specific serine/threonine protein kinase n=1 Tax=Kribbella amoyensis TaxID=996641 RepID=A0A561C0K0_9ACTN|nr:serine/threonine-protein kinase [Kribbella amoyensis]TWD84681.1 serine/threonine-protein kinase [Kribbella amoyensis]
MSASELSGGLVAGRYRIGGPIGRGGMGQVYRATDEILERDLAIKVILPTHQDSTAAERFLREARAAARIVDPHVVATFDFGSHDGASYLAMELVEGHSLAEELQRTGVLAPAVALDIVRQAAAGLAAAHAQDIVHRDVKPANLLIAADGTVKVADFGIARVLDEATSTLTGVGQLVGTTHYLAPERALQRPAYAASDVYSLGCVFYQMVTGQPPFRGESPTAVLYQHVEEVPSAPSHHRGELTAEIDSLALWMLAKDPADRPTAAQVAAGVTAPGGPEAAAVRREHSRRFLAGAGAIAALAVSATVGVLLGLGDLRPPTADLVPPGSNPSQVRTTEPSRADPSSQATADSSSTAPDIAVDHRTSPVTSPGGGDPSQSATPTPSTPPASTSPSKQPDSTSTPPPSTPPTTPAPDPSSTRTPPPSSPVAPSTTPSATSSEVPSTPPVTPNQTSTEPAPKMASEAPEG